MTSLETLRETNIVVARDGSILHGITKLQHARLCTFILRKIAYHSGEQRYIVWLDSTRYGYIVVEDVPLVVVSLRWKDSGALVLVNDGQQDTLDLTMMYRIGDVPYCYLKKRKLIARLSTVSYATLVTKVASVDGEYRLVVGDLDYRIRERQTHLKAGSTEG